MTPKRFTINNDIDFNDKVETYEVNCIVDNENKTFYFIADSIENVQLFVKRLNELYEENQFLKKRLEFFYELNKPYGTIIEENQKLKSFINRLTNDCGEIVLMNGIGYNVEKIFGDLE